MKSHIFNNALVISRTAMGLSLAISKNAVRRLGRKGLEPIYLGLTFDAVKQALVFGIYTYKSAQEAHFDDINS